MITINDFKSNIKSFAKPNRFLVDITLNTTGFEKNPFGYLPINFLDSLKYLIQDAVIPNRTQNNISVKYHGMKLEVPGDYDHSDLTLKIINAQIGDTKNWNVRNFFETWMNLIQNINGNNTRLDSIPFLDIATIKITQIGNSEDEKLATYKFYNIYLKDLGQIQLSMGTDSYETFDVVFAYSHWE